MHILASLFVLTILVLVFGIIGGILFFHRVRIGNALAGRSSKADLRVTFVSFSKNVTFGKNQALPKSTRRLPIEAQPSLPLVA